MRKLSGELALLPISAKGGLFKEKSRFILTFLFAAALSVLLLLPSAILPLRAHATEDLPERIHVMAHTYSDCIILESDGFFGIVDSGEDNDYPDGLDPRYPLRPGTTRGGGHEDEVIQYLYDLGVTTENLEFYIGTHPHSDHIGSADEIIRTFHPKRVYTPAYNDCVVGSEALLWDNQYVYDHLIEAACELNIPVILNLDPGAPLIPVEYEDGNRGQDFEQGAGSGLESVDQQAAEAADLGGFIGNPTFSLGSFEITIVNYEDKSYQTTSNNDGNNFSWGVVVEAHGKRAYLGGDINNVDGDEVRLAAQVGKVDLVKLSHHGAAQSNTAPMIEALSPTFAFQTGSRHRLCSETYTALTRVGTRLFSADVVARQGLSAMIAEFTPERVYVNAMDGCIHYDLMSAAPYVYVSLDGLPYSLDGWHTFNGISYWFENSPIPACSCWLSLDGNWLWLDEYGQVSTGFVTVGGQRYIFNDEGVLYTNQWVDKDGLRYRVNALGEMQFGWFSLDGKSYYLDPASGAMVRGLYTIGKDTYYFLEDGSLRNGWMLEDGIWRYYSGASEAPQTGWIRDGGLTYYVGDDGLRVSGWRVIDGSTYHFDDAGIMSKGWVRLDAIWYYCNPTSGVLETGWLNLGGTWYYTNAQGEMQTGWLKSGNRWYYLDPIDGSMRTGWFMADDCWYFANASGAMQTGWIYNNGCWYYLANSGAMKTGWFKVGGNWYFANGSGVMQVGWLWDGAAWYYLDPTGAMATGWRQVGGTWYYLQPSGVMATGQQWIGGALNSFSRSGAWLG